jgi:hypothetical protein
MNPVLYQNLEQRRPRKIGERVRRDGKHYLSISPIMGTIISLNNMAGEIYLMCDGKRTIGEMAREFCEQYTTVDPERIKEDVCRCVADLESVHMVSVVQISESA